MKRRILLIAILSFHGGCANSKQIKALSSEARSDLSELGKAYSAFAKNSNAIGKKRTEADADYKKALVNLEQFDEDNKLIDQVADHPIRQLHEDLNILVDRRKERALSTSQADEVQRALSAQISKVSAPTASLNKASVELKNLTKKRDKYQSFLNFVIFARETLAIIDEKLKEGETLRNQIQNVDEKDVPAS